MKAWLIYTEYECRRNEFLVNKILSELTARNVEAKLLLRESITYNEKLSYQGEILDFPDFVIMRCVDVSLGDFLEKNTKVFNNRALAKVANDKYSTYLLAKKLGISVLDTALNKRLKKPYPLVIKPTDGHGGANVFLVGNDYEYDCAVAQQSGDYICQQPCDEPGSDTRVYVLFGQPIVAVERRTDCGFRANFCLGATAKVVPVAEEMKDTVKLLAEIIPLDYCGVDFLRHDGGYVLNEIEDVVGARMIYTLTDIDIIAIFIDKIMQNLQ
ncbi:MAG: RimK family alpha-L-glutamate ligase [Christensenellaceae bacterium]